MIILVVEAGAEEGRVVTKKFFVEGPACVFLADVDVYEGCAEELVEWLVGWSRGGGCDGGHGR